MSSRFSRRGTGRSTGGEGQGETKGIVLKEGYLRKKGGINPRLKERRFVLRPNTLDYFDGKVFKGTIPLNKDCKVIPCPYS